MPGSCLALPTHVEVVRRLEEVVQLDNVGVALRDLLEDLDLVADLLVSARSGVARSRGHIPCARAPVASAHTLCSSRPLTVRNFLFRTLHA